MRPCQRFVSLESNSDKSTKMAEIKPDKQTDRQREADRQTDTEKERQTDKLPACQTCVSCVDCAGRRQVAPRL